MTLKIKQECNAGTMGLALLGLAIVSGVIEMEIAVVCVGVRLGTVSRLLWSLSGGRGRGSLVRGVVSQLSSGMNGAPSFVC